MQEIVIENPQFNPTKKLHQNRQNVGIFTATLNPITVTHSGKITQRYTVIPTCYVDT